MCTGCLMVYICKGRVSGFVRIEGAQAKARCKEVDRFFCLVLQIICSRFFFTKPPLKLYIIMYLLSGVCMCSGVFRSVFATLFGERVHC